ncbi:hypothetical protein [Chryseobacterium populi]|nr:hypothetical protein [Chryseobacterium populi]
MIKTAIALRLLLSRNKSHSQSYDSDNIDSYEKIAINSNADIRKATVTNAFSGKKKIINDNNNSYCRINGIYNVRFWSAIQQCNK